MPLGKNIQRNIRELKHAKKKRPMRQIIAIAYSAANKNKKQP